MKGEEAGEEVLSVSLRRIFLGNPGTGKTTVATLYGKLLAEMGFLSNGEVIVRGASSLTGAHIGSTAKIVNELMDSLTGKVLVIDEAYVLADTQYGREALDVLVECVQGVEDFAVILCGYNDPIRKMLKDCNPGLARRFKLDDAFMFDDYFDAELQQIMLDMSANMGLHVTSEVAATVVRRVLSKQRARAHFGNAGAVKNSLERATIVVMSRPDRCKEMGRWLVQESDFESAIEGEGHFDKRKRSSNVRREQGQTQLSGSSAQSSGDLNSSAGVPIMDQATTGSDHAVLEHTVMEESAADCIAVMEESAADHIARVECATDHTVIEETTLETENWELVSEEADEEEQVEIVDCDNYLSTEDDSSIAGPSIIDIWACLEEACTKLGYSLEHMVKFLRSGDYPEDLMAMLLDRHRPETRCRCVRCLNHSELKC
ncbi:AAA family ATPase [archaeon]|nr:MAG: AAA family ATPase [archaeon]